MGRGRRRDSCAVRTAIAIAALAVLPAVSAQPAQAAALPIVVNDARDLPDVSIGNGACATSGGRCTLRAAIQEANALVGHDTINVPPGVYELEVPFVNEDTQSTGDHDIADSVSIVGTGPAATIVDGGFPTASAPVEARGIDRVFEIHPTAGNVTFRALTIREGYSEEGGGGIQNWSPGLLTLENVHILDNLAGKAGGGLNNDDPHNYEWPTGSLPETATIPSGRVQITSSRLAGNSASEGGAAINNVSNGSVTITNSQVVDNPGRMIPDPAQVIDPLEPEPI
jgi:CSLREA domain-containing protein